MRGASIEPYRAYIPIKAQLVGNFNGDNRSKISLAGGKLTVTSKGTSWIDKLELRDPVPGAPTPVAPFSHAVETDGWIFLTGQMPTSPHDDTAPLPAGIEAQTRRVMENLIIVLGGLDLALPNVVSVRIYLTRFEQDYAPMNAVYRSYFPLDRLPARTCVGVTALARGALVEIDLIARRP
jgi:reactive intermediate/imine deaminase